jgi:excisionase family DNA binding protein
MPEADDELLTLAEVAAMRKLNRQTVRNWLDAGKLPYIRIGRGIRIKRSDFNRLIEHGRRAIRQPTERRSRRAGGRGSAA